MIELRWLVRRVRRPVGIDDGFYNPRLDPMIDVPTLQYRDRVDADTATQWQDAPLVREP